MELTLLCYEFLKPSSDLVVLERSKENINTTLIREEKVGGKRGRGGGGRRGEGRRGEGGGRRE